MLTQADNTNDKDLLNIMKEYIRVTYNKPGEAFLAMVHRLDRVTGGVVVFAKTSKAASRLSDQIRKLEWKKNYLVISDNIPKDNEKRLVNYLYKDTKSNISYVSNKNKPGSKKAILEYSLLDTFNNKSLLEIDLITGRSHQIRVQLANSNLAIYGDHRYNKKVKKNTQIKLFAHSLEIIHPTLKEKIIFKAPIPEFGLWKQFSK